MKVILNQINRVKPKQYINDTYKRLLHNRFVVENFFSLLKRRFLRISIINDYGVQKNKYL